MSKVCKYYLSGNCRYGDRCHFLHESYNYKENYYSNRDDNRRNYGSGNKSTYSYNHDNSYQNRNHYTYEQRTNYSYQNRNNYTWTKQSATDGGTSNNYDKAYNYNRYHTDNRSYNRTDDKLLLSQLSVDEVHELIVHKLKQFEERHVWRLTVVSPLKYVGNIPGLEDVSPEEIRYQFYRSTTEESVAQFLHEYDAALKKVAEVCGVLKSKSQESAELVKKMLQRVDSNDDEMTTDSTGKDAMSSFSFNLNALPQNKPTTAATEFAPADQNRMTFTSVFGNTASVASGFSFNVPSTNNVASAQSSVFNAFPTSSPFPTATSTWPTQNQSNTNSFSFNNLQTATGTGTAVNLVANHNVGRPNDDDPTVYSNVEQLSSEILDAFRAKTFKYGQVPLVAPPRTLCSV